MYDEVYDRCLSLIHRVAVRDSGIDAVHRRTLDASQSPALILKYVVDVVTTEIPCIDHLHEAD